MATIQLTDDNFAEEIRRAEIVLVDFWAEWCGPCRTEIPELNGLAEQLIRLGHEFGVLEKQRITIINEYEDGAAALKGVGKNGGGYRRCGCRNPRHKWR